MSPNLHSAGYIILARQILDSEIWNKPSDWLKIWVYILEGVHYLESKGGKRGENWFNLRDMARDCHVSYSTIDHCLRWLKSAKQIATRKATRGMFIFVLKYEQYQDPDFYKSDTESDARGEMKATQKRNESDTIKEEGKKETKKEVTYVTRPETEALYETIEETCQKYGLQNNVNKKALDVLVERYVGRIHMKVELQHCVSWLIDKNLKMLNCQRIGNWFKKSQEIQKREQNKLLEKNVVKKPSKSSGSVDHFMASPFAE